MAMLYDPMAFEGLVVLASASPALPRKNDWLQLNRIVVYSPDVEKPRQ